MTRGADEPTNEDVTPEPPDGAEPTLDGADDGVEVSSFDPELIAHMVRCWDAETENAERLNKKISLLVSVLALLFGLGVFKIDWTYDPKHLSRVHPLVVLWGVKIVLVCALFCFGWGLYTRCWRGFRQVNNSGPPNQSSP